MPTAILKNAQVFINIKKANFGIKKIIKSEKVHQKMVNIYPTESSNFS